jgi:2-aminoadipate transaminase
MMINFARGHPNPSLLPIEAMKEGLELVRCHGNLASCLPYPSADQDNGSTMFRNQLSLFLHQHTENDDMGGFNACTTNEFFATHGVSHAIELLCAVLTKPGDVVGIEVPTYFLVTQILENHGLALQPMPMKDFRLDVKSLEIMLESGQLQPIPKVIYTIPTNHNPTASTLPIEDRIQLAKIARRYNIIVIADEVYHLLDWKVDVTRPARMASFNHNVVEESIHGCCLSVSSFTKIFCPGIRCGWVEGPLPIIHALERYGYIRSQGGCVPFVGEVMKMIMESGLATRVLHELQAAYQERAKILYNALIDEAITVCIPPTGGYFLWVLLPVDNVANFLIFCQDRGVQFLPGNTCDPFQGKSCASYARLCFADLPMNDLTKGAKLLGKCLCQYNSENQSLI